MRGRSRGNVREGMFVRERSRGNAREGMFVRERSRGAIFRATVQNSCCYSNWTGRVKP